MISKDEDTAALLSVLTISGSDLISVPEPVLSKALLHRMRCTGSADRNEYLTYLSKNPEEIEGMIGTLRSLIGVTNDHPELYDTLETKIIPLTVLHSSLRGEGRIRVWIEGTYHPIVPYRVAILFLELMEDVLEHYSVEVLCDPDDLKNGSECGAGDFSICDLPSTDRERLSRYLTDNGRPRPGAALSKMIVYRKRGPDWPSTNAVDLMLFLDHGLQTDRRALKRRMRAADRSLSAGALFYMSWIDPAASLLPDHFRPVAVLPGLYIKE